MQQRSLRRNGELQTVGCSGLQRDGSRDHAESGEPSSSDWGRDVTRERPARSQARGLVVGLRINEREARIMLSTSSVKVTLIVIPLMTLIFDLVVVFRLRAPTSRTCRVAALASYTIRDSPIVSARDRIER